MKYGILMAVLLARPALSEAGELLSFPPSAVDPQTRSYRLDPARALAIDPVTVVDGERIAATLMDLLGRPSRSCRETAVAARAVEVLAQAGDGLGIEIGLDDLPARAAALSDADRKEIYCDNGATAPESGNLIAVLAGDAALPSWNLSFHLDTNQTAFDGFTREGDLIRPPPGSPLGADDKAGLAIIVEIIRILREQAIAHGDIRVVGLVAEEDSTAGARLIDGAAFAGDVQVSIDGTDPEEIGVAAPTMYNGYLTVRTRTSHPAEVDVKRAVSACAVGARILWEAGFRADAHPPGHPQVVLHSYFASCGIDGGGRTPKGEPIADYQYNSISPYWTSAWQLRSLEDEARTRDLVAVLSATIEGVCVEAADGRSAVDCAITGAERPALPGYVVAPDAPAVRLLEAAFAATGGRPVIKRQQFGAFNGNYIKSRFGEEMILLGTGADQIHTTEETVSVRGMARVARGLLAAILASYRYTRVP
jgi:tripeptide aminopeptidase